MQEYLHVILHAAIDTAKILPFLFIVYYIIELIEYKFAIKIKNNKMLKGKASPVFGSLLGCIPQCGFSVISTDLFGKGAISVGALIAVYIATSDEAIPIMLSSPSSIPWMLALIGIKIVLGILFGYLAILLHKLIFKKKTNYIEETHKNEKHVHADEHSHGEHEEHNHKENENKTLISQDGCCHHHVDDKSFDWVHPLLHCVKIGLFILVINLLFGSIVHFVGEDNLTNFLNAGKFVQPLLAVVIGLIPNCASSVILADLFVMGGLSFGALVSGLCVNAGLGVIMLIKQNKNWKETLFIVLTLLISSLIAGYALIFI
jgi:ABC-type nickel/cobalt efflux system permease component RcnA